RVADKAKHPDEPVGKLDRIRRWVAGLPALSPDIRPDGAEVAAVLVGVQQAERALRVRWLTVAPRLPKQENVFDVVLDDGVRLVRFAEEPRCPTDLSGHIGDLGPQDRREVVKTDSSRAYRDVGV